MLPHLIIDPFYDLTGVRLLVKAYLQDRALRNGLLEVRHF